jgi:hypothetical protein
MGELLQRSWSGLFMAAPSFKEPHSARNVTRLRKLVKRHIPGNPAPGTLSPYSRYLARSLFLSNGSPLLILALSNDYLQYQITI